MTFSGAYFLAQTVADGCVCLVMPVAYLIIFVHLFWPRSGWSATYGVLVMLFFACRGIGWFVALLFHPRLDRAMICASTLLLTTGLYLGGVLLPLADMTPLEHVISFTSVTRWSVEAIYAVELDALPPHFTLNSQTVPSLFARYGFRSGAYGSDVAALLVIGVAFRLLCYIVMLGNKYVGDQVLIHGRSRVSEFWLGMCPWLSCCGDSGDAVPVDAIRRYYGEDGEGCWSWCKHAVAAQTTSVQRLVSLPGSSPRTS